MNELMYENGVLVARSTTKWDIRFLKLAEQIASFSKDPSTKTGAVLVRNRLILGTGFNGFPRGMPDNADYYANRDEKYERIVHCEVNAMIFARQPLDGATLYTWPFLSCHRCAVQMLQAGVVRFVAPVATPDQATRWEAMFKKTRLYAHECGAQIEEIPMEVIRGENGQI